MFLAIASGNGWADRASLVVYADTGGVLHATNANLASRPASLTRLMTVYLTLAALAARRVGMGDMLQVSATAQAQPAVRLGLTQGSTMSVEDGDSGRCLPPAPGVGVERGDRRDGAAA